jgi:ATP-dependent Clp protease ATP-binding subunit ClpA
MLSLAAVESQELGKEYVGSEHLLLAFLRDPTTGPAIVLALHGVTFDNVRQDVVRIYDLTMVWPGPAT